MPDNSLTPAQATDLARYFLGTGWKADYTGDRRCALHQHRSDRAVRHISQPSWRAVFREAGVHLPVRSRFVAIGTAVMNGERQVATCVSTTYAKRTANALDEYDPGPKGY